MRMVKIPHTDLEVSLLCLGCVGLAGRWQKVSLTAEHEAQAHAFLDAAEELGVNFFTSDGRHAALLFARRGEKLRPISRRAMRKKEKEAYDAAT